MNGFLKKFKCPEGEEELTTNFQREIYSEKEYERFGIKIEDGDIVLDAGANVGIFTQYAMDMGASRVLSYECEELFFKCFKDNIIDKRANCTLGFVGHNFYDLPKILKQHKIDMIDFAKIDIEGAEFDMFNNMQNEDLRRVRKWAIEFHTLAGNHNFSMEDRKNKLWSLLEILEKFSINGFDIYFEQIHKGWDVVHLFAKISDK